MFQGECDPSIDRALVRVALRADGEDSAHRPGRHEIPEPRVRALKLLRRGPRVKPNYQIIAIHPAAHVPGDHKRQAPEHRLFHHVRTTL